MELKPDIGLRFEGLRIIAELKRTRERFRWITEGKYGANKVQLDNSNLIDNEKALIKRDNDRNRGKD